MVVTTEVVLMTQWVGYNFAIKPHVFYMYYFNPLKPELNPICYFWHY